ncbi:HAD-IA family hydrolase [Priestia koreensis]|uniref:HAD-IA family hydrolase n=1 Tax=Priestia koreensis TaxID=284581 RepID=UPI003CFCAE79
MNILWDFDGTLFDTYPAYTRTFSKVLGERVHPSDIYKQLKISFTHAINYYQLTEAQLEEMARMNKHDVSLDDFKPFPHVEQILTFADKNVIMTHKSRKGVLDILNHYGWTDYFADIVTIDDGFPRKPHAASYEYLHEKHKLNMAIGDRELDLLPAKEIGLVTCMFQGQSDVADYHLDSYEDFFNIDFVKVASRLK